MIMATIQKATDQHRMQRTSWIVLFYLIRHHIQKCVTKASTLYHTIPIFNDLGKRSILKTLWEKEKMMVSSIFSVAHDVSTLSKTNFNFSVAFICCLQILPISTCLNPFPNKPCL